MPYNPNENYNGQTKLKDWWGIVKANFSSIFTIVNDETTARTQADTNLQNNIDAEITARQNADTTLAGSISAETTVRENAINALHDSLATETINRQSADGTLTNNLNLEVTNRQTADTNLQNSINNVNFDLQQEINERLGADSTLQNDINAEVAARQNADSTLQANITAEATARTNADKTLQANIDNEVTARKLADTTLQNNIAAEANARQTACATLESEIGSVKSLTVEVEGSLDSHIADFEDYKKSSSKLITPYTLKADTIDGYTPIVRVSTDYDFKIKWDNSGDGFLDIVFNTGQVDINTQLGMVVKKRTGTFINISPQYISVLDNDTDNKKVAVGLKLYDNGTIETFKDYGKTWTDIDGAGYGQIEPTAILGSNYIIYPLCSIDFSNSTSKRWYINGIADESIEIYAGSNKLIKAADIDNRGIGNHALQYNNADVLQWGSNFVKPKNDDFSFGSLSNAVSTGYFNTVSSGNSRDLYLNANGTGTLQVNGVNKVAWNNDWVFPITAGIMNFGHPNLMWGCVYTNDLKSGTNCNLHLTSTAGVGTLSTPNNTYIWDDGGIRPASTRVGDLGSDTYSWNNIFTGSIYSTSGGNSGRVQIPWANTFTNTLSSGSSTHLHINANGLVVLQNNGVDKYYIDGDNFYPTSKTNLGNPEYPWGAVYTQTVLGLGSYLTLHTDQIGILSAGDNGKYCWDYEGFRPYSANGVNLGHPDITWNAVYTNNLSSGKNASLSINTANGVGYIQSAGTNVLQWGSNYMTPSSWGFYLGTLTNPFTVGYITNLASGANQNLSIDATAGMGYIRSAGTPVMAWTSGDLRSLNLMDLGAPGKPWNTVYCWMVSSDDNSPLSLNANDYGVMAIQGTNVLAWTSTELRPADVSPYNLGSPSKPFTKVYATNGTIQTSDIRLKDNITEYSMDKAYDIVKNLATVSFNWRDKRDSDTHVGFIAQDVEKAGLAEAVHIESTDEYDDLRLISKDAIFAIDHQALRKLIAKNEELEERIKALETAT